MAKNKPRLKLVGGDGSSSFERGLGVSDGFDFAALSELSPGERKRVSRLVAAAAPRAGVIAVARTYSNWDIRPVVMLSDEDGPTIIRSAGPDIAISAALSSRLRETLERILRFHGVTPTLCAIGECDGQLWFRRALAPATLAHQLSGDSSFDWAKIKSIISLLTDEIGTWHAQGLIHGHISTSNIQLTEEGLLLLDPAIGAALVQTSAERPAELAQSIAPEIFEGNAPAYSADLYGLGQVLRRLLLSTRKRYQFSPERTQVFQELEPFQQYCNLLVDPDPNARPTLPELRLFLTEQLETRPAQPAPRSARTAPPSSGKLVRPEALAANPFTMEPEDEGDPLEEFEAPLYAQHEFSEEVGLQEGAGYAAASSGRYSGGADVKTSIYRAMTESKKDKRSRSSAARDSKLPEPELVAGEEFDLDDQELALEDEDLFDFEEEIEQVELPRKKAKPARTSTRTPRRTPPKHIDREGSSLSGIAIFFSIIAVALLGVYLFKLRGPTIETLEYSMEELRAGWESKIPSRMITVAEIAVAANVDNRSVQDLIVASAKNGDPLPGTVDVGLLRIAFNDRWEMELQPEDRRMAIAFALAGLLRERMPTDLGPLDQRHPGVLLAVAATAGKNVSKFLAPIPALVLTKLSPPFGPAFQRLIEADSNLTCASESVQLLAQFGTTPPHAQDIAAFLQNDPTVRLQALALMFSHDDAAARGMLDALLNHPNIVIDTPEVTWARTWDLLSWNELENADKLFVVSGAPPVGRISAENVAKMFTHPAPAIRSFAIAQALDRIKFDHPAAFAVLKQVEEKPELLNPEQLFRLAELLQNPTKAEQARIEAWLATEPPLELVGQLLIATASAKEPLPLDTWLAIYLKRKEWNPNIVAMRKLSMHPDRYTRLFTYTLIHKMPDQEAARLFLQTALGKESDPNYRRQLELMIAQLNAKPGTAVHAPAPDIAPAAPQVVPAPQMAPQADEELEPFQ